MSVVCSFRSLYSQGDSLSGDFFFRSLHSQGDSLSGDFFPEFVFSFFPEIFFPEFAFSRRFSFRGFFFRSLYSQGDSLFSGDFFSGVCILVFILAPFFKHLCVGVSLVLRSVFMFSTLFCFKDALKKSD